MLSRLRPASETLARQLVRPLRALGVRAHHLTTGGLACGVGAGVAVSWGWHRSAFGLGLLAAGADWLDGPLARERAQASATGSLFDAIADRLVEGSLLVGLAPFAPRLACACLLLSLLTSYIKARTGLVIPLDNRDWPGCGDRADRMVLLLGALLAPVLLWALLVLTLTGCLQRWGHARRLIGGSPAERQPAGQTPGISDPDAAPPLQLKSSPHDI